MSYQYDQYLEKHKANVIKGFEWMQNNIPEVLERVEDCDLGHQICIAHDYSKIYTDEYDAYDSYFYGGNKSFEVVEKFNIAWLNHIHRNPHHWQHWVLINDDPEKSEIILDMPLNYIIEMICDWWSFSWERRTLSYIFDWYDKHKGYMKLSSNTRKEVEYILDKIRGTLLRNGNFNELVTSELGTVA